MKQQSKTVLITGTNRGIGLEFVKQYAEAGWEVLAGCRNRDKANALQVLAKQFANVTILPSLDVTKTTDIQNMINFVGNKAIDVVINNAGIYGGGEQSFGNISMEAMNTAFLTNTLAPLKISEALLPNLKKGKLKIIANISTLMGSIQDNTSGGYYAYRTSKAALNMVMKNLSIDLQAQGIIVIMLHPGWVKTDMGGKNAPLDVETSVHHLRKVISAMKSDDTGKFYSYLGESIAW